MVHRAAGGRDSGANFERRIRLSRSPVEGVLYLDRTGRPSVPALWVKVRFPVVAKVIAGFIDSILWTALNFRVTVLPNPHHSRFKFVAMSGDGDGF